MLILVNKTSPRLYKFNPKLNIRLTDTDTNSYEYNAPRVVYYYGKGMPYLDFREFSDLRTMLKSEWRPT